MSLTQIKTSLGVISFLQDEFLAGLQRKEDAKTWQNPLWEKRTKPPDDW